MTKNNLNNDVVHHMKIMMQTQRKRHLPSVGIACFAGASHLLSDSPTSHCKMFLPEKQAMPIKLIPFDKKVI